MLQIIFEPSKKIFLESDGTRFLLFDGSDVFANHSAVSMAIPFKEYLSGTEPFNFYRKLSDIIDGFSNGTAFALEYTLLMLRSLPALLKKYRPYRFLKIGGTAADELSVQMASLLKIFHPGSAFYCLSDAAPSRESPAISVVMDPARMILPEKHFDLIILDEATLGQPLPASILLPALSSLRPDGRLLSLMNPGELKQHLLAMLPDGSHFSLEANRFLYEKDLTPADWFRLYERTPAGILHRKKQTVSRLMAETETLLRESPDHLEAMLERADEMETILLEIYSDLVSISVKYHLSRWKEMLMDFRLGLATVKEVLEAFMKLKSDMTESADFLPPD